jgi:alanine racemase
MIFGRQYRRGAVRRQYRNPQLHCGRLHLRSKQCPSAGEMTASPPLRLARATIDVEAVAANWRTFQALAPDAECAAAVKADAYGLGADAIGLALARAGCRTFFCATAGEALALRGTLGAGPTIYALNGPAPSEIALFAAAAITPVINSLAQAALWDGPAALHIDTGMNRLGLPIADLGRLARRDFMLVMSHLACAATPEHPLNARQLARFRAACAGFDGVRRSLASTAGAQLGAAYHFDMTRIGLGLFGAADRADGVALACAARIEAPVLQVREVVAGESFGYGATVVAERPMRAATAAIGYADGFLRSLGGAGYGVRGFGVLGGRRRPILGRVSMDLVILDVTEEPRVREGDMAQFLGPEAPLEEVARRAGASPYEILTTLVGQTRRMGAGA